MSVGTGKAGYKFSKKSWHAKLNRFTWGSDYLDNVDCLCPYFWGTICAIMGIGLTLLAKGIKYAVENFPRTNWTLPSFSEETKHRCSMFTAYTMVGLAGFGATYGFLWSVATYGIIHTLFWIGVFVGIFFALVGLALLLIKIAEKINNREKRPNILMEMIRAKKNKHCPLLQWND